MSPPAERPNGGFPGIILTKPKLQKKPRLFSPVVIKMVKDLRPTAPSIMEQEDMFEVASSTGISKDDLKMINKQK